MSKNRFMSIRSQILNQKRPEGLIQIYKRKYAVKVFLQFLYTTYVVVPHSHTMNLGIQKGKFACNFLVICQTVLLQTLHMLCTGLSLCISWVAVMFSEADAITV